SKHGLVTLDNASNCDTKLAGLERRFMSLAIPFSSLGNRIRYFFEDPGNQGYIAALNTDPIKAARELVNACRASGLRKHDFLLAISEGNKLDKFSGVQLRRAQLLRDVDTRWSSTYLMIDRVLEMYPAINYYIRERQTDIPQSKLLTLDQLLVLNDIRDFLSIPHAVQELLSAQQTPTLSNVLPAYEKLIVILKGVIEDLPGLSHCILTAIFKFDEYLAKSRTAPVYGIAMALNPTIKLKFMQDRWSSEDSASVEQKLRDSVSLRNRMCCMRNTAEILSSDARVPYSCTAFPERRARCLFSYGRAHIGRTEFHCK
ncbi:hypothetical protein BV25DRAFT_1810362, partial [Artomyces pyxidatus]